MSLEGTHNGASGGPSKSIAAAAASAAIDQGASVEDVALTAAAAAEEAGASEQDIAKAAGKAAGLTVHARGGTIADAAKQGAEQAQDLDGNVETCGMVAGEVYESCGGSKEEAGRAAAEAATAAGGSPGQVCKVAARWLVKDEAVAMGEIAGEKAFRAALAKSLEPPSGEQKRKAVAIKAGLDTEAKLLALIDEKEKVTNFLEKIKEDPSESGWQVSGLHPGTWGPIVEMERELASIREERIKHRTELLTEQNRSRVFEQRCHALEKEAKSVLAYSKQAQQSISQPLQQRLLDPEPGAPALRSMPPSRVPQSRGGHLGVPSPPPAAISTKLQGDAMPASTDSAVRSPPPVEGIIMYELPKPRQQVTNRAKSPTAHHSDSQSPSVPRRQAHIVPESNHHRTELIQARRPSEERILESHPVTGPKFASKQWSGHHFGPPDSPVQSAYAQDFGGPSGGFYSPFSHEKFGPEKSVRPAHKSAGPPPSHTVGDRPRPNPGL